MTTYVRDLKNICATWLRLLLHFTAKIQQFVVCRLRLFFVLSWLSVQQLFWLSFEKVMLRFCVLLFGDEY
jgi:hypothetical protein